MSYFKKTGDFIKNTATSAGSKWEKTSTTAKACIIGSTTALAATVAAPLVILPVLNVVGFTSTGVAARSIAASMQTATTVSGWIFALCQSAGATGVLATSTSVGVRLTAGTTAAGVTVLASRNSSSNSNNDEQGQTGTHNNDGTSDINEEQVETTNAAESDNNSQGQTGTHNNDGTSDINEEQVETTNAAESDNNGQEPVEIEESVAGSEENIQSLSSLNSDMFNPNGNNPTTLNHV